MKYEELKKRLIEENSEVKAEYLKRDLALEISELITRARISASLTQAQLAKHVGTKQSAISRVESGISTPNVSFLEKIATALNKVLLIEFRDVENKTISGWSTTESGDIISPYEFLGNREETSKIQTCLHASS